MQTTATRPSRARQPAAAQVSPIAAKLIQQIQSEARAALLAELSAKDTIIVLHGFDAETKRVRVSADTLRIRDDKGNACEMYRTRTEPESWRNNIYMQGHWHPARWYGSQTLVDASGNEWRRDLAPHVCDDFGNLVQVAA